MFWILFGNTIWFIFLDHNFISIENINLIFSLYPVLLCFIFYNFLNKSYLGDGGSYVLSFIVATF